MFIYGKISDYASAEFSAFLYSWDFEFHLHKTSSSEGRSAVDDFRKLPSNRFRNCWARWRKIRCCILHSFCNYQTRSLFYDGNLITVENFSSLVDRDSGRHTHSQMKIWKIPSGKCEWNRFKINLDSCRCRDGCYRKRKSNQSKNKLKIDFSIAPFKHFKFPQRFYPPTPSDTL